MFLKNLLATSALLSTLVVCAPTSIHAQTEPQSATAVPNVLVIVREFTKPGREGSQHGKTEAAFAQAARAGHAKTHYVGMTSLSGPNRSIFLSGYSSMDAWDQAYTSDHNDATLANTIDQANQADGEMLTSSEQSVWRNQPDLSTNPGLLKDYRAMSFTTIRVRPGHHDECVEVVKMVEAAANKANPDRHLTVWNEAYGSPGGGMLIVQGYKSGADMDKSHQASEKGYRAAMGPEGTKKVQALENSCMQSVETNLFLMSPKMSYPPDSFSSDPYWKQSSESSEPGTN